MTSIQIDRTDGLSSSVAIKAPVVAATTANIVLSSLQTIDGVALADNDRVLVKNQTNALENGIYIANTGVWRRSRDFSGNRDVKTGTMVNVTGGTQAGWWQVTTANPIVIDTTSIAFGQRLQPYDADLASWATIVRAAGFDAFVASPSSANLRTLITDETGSGSAVFSASPVFSGLVGMGRTATTEVLEVSENFRTVGTQTRIQCDRFNNVDDAGPHIVCRAATGTEGSPTAPLLGYRIGNFGWRPYDGTAFVNTTVAAMKAVAAENFASGSCGTDVYITTSPIGSATEVERIRVTNAGQLLVGTSTARDANPSSTKAHFQVEGLDAATAAASIFANINGTGGATLFLGKSRGTVNGSTTIVQSGDTAGTLSFRALDGSTPASVASIAATVDGTPGAGSMPGKLTLGTTASGAASTTARMTIDSVGFTSVSGGSFGRGAPVTKTADFTVAATENWLINNKSGSSCTVTLPTASSFTGREITIKTIQAQTVVSASSNVVPLAGGAAGTAILAATAGKWATLVSDGTNWVIMQAA